MYDNFIKGDRDIEYKLMIYECCTMYKFWEIEWMWLVNICMIYEDCMPSMIGEN
jgi:hypothetical protein